jgi:hypothetical protein
MRHLSLCPIRDGVSFVERYPATFDGDWCDAVPDFVTGRTRAGMAALRAAEAVASHSPFHSSRPRNTLVFTRQLNLVLSV